MRQQTSTLFQSDSNALDECPACASKKFKDLIQVNVQMHPAKICFQFQQCINCKLVLLNPRPSLDQLKSYYTDYYLPYRGAAAWGKYSALVQSSQKQLDQRRAKLVHQYIPLSKETLVLDIGCGKPSFLKTCHDLYGCPSLGIDFSDTGWKATPEAFKGVDLFVGQVKDLAIDQRPSAITMWHYLEHDYAPLDTLTRLRSLAKAGTSLFIEVPNYDSESRRIFGEYWAGYHTPRHTFLFSPDNIGQLLQRAGWQISELRTAGTLDPYLLYWMSRMEKKEIDWSTSMEPRFINFLLGKIKFEIKNLLQKKKSQGIMLVIAKAV